MVDADLADAAAVTQRNLQDAGLQVQSCRAVRANLEDVFVAATQERKAQRDGGE
jgi:hypothetical protein